jgi:hypothetical protein
MGTPLQLAEKIDLKIVLEGRDFSRAANAPE